MVVCRSSRWRFCRLVLMALDCLAYQIEVSGVTSLGAGVSPRRERT